MKRISIIVLSTAFYSSCFCMDITGNNTISNSSEVNSINKNTLEIRDEQSIKISDIIISTNPSLKETSSEMINTSESLIAKVIEPPKALDSEIKTEKITLRHLPESAQNYQKTTASITAETPEEIETTVQITAKTSTPVKKEIIRQVTSIDARYLQYSKGKAIVEVITNAWQDTSSIIRERGDYISTACSILNKMIHYKNELKEKVLRTFNVATNDPILKSALKKSTHRWYIDLETFEDQYGRNLEFIQNGKSTVGEIINQLVQDGAYYMTADGLISYKEEQVLKAFEKVQNAIDTKNVISEVNEYNAIVNQINTNLASIISTPQDEQTASNFENIDIFNLQTKLYAASSLAILINNKNFPGAFYKSRVKELLNLCQTQKNIFNKNQNLFSLRTLKVYNIKNQYIADIYDVKLNPKTLKIYEEKKQENNYRVDLEQQKNLKHTLTLIKFWLLKWRYDLKMTLPGINLE